MKSAPVKFLTLVFILTVICAALQWLWNNQAPEKMRLYDGFWLLGIFAVTVTVVHLLMLNAKSGDGSAFIRAFMLSTTLKFFFYLLVDANERLDQLILDHLCIRHLNMTNVIIT